MSTPDAHPPHPSQFPSADVFRDRAALEPPAVVFWFKLYAAALALWNLLFVPVGLLVFIVTMSVGDDTVLAGGTFASLLFTAAGLLFAAIFALPIFLKPRPWVWTYSLVIIVLSLPSPCCMPAAIPLLIFWVKDDTRLWYGMR